MIIDQKKYFKKPGSKYYMCFYYLIADVNGEVKFLIQNIFMISIWEKRL